MRYFILSFFILYVGVCAYPQTPVLNQEKYEHYRTRLKEQFMLYSGDATVQGSHLPMESLLPNASGRNTGYWADAVWWLGHYVAMLSIEYKILQNNNLDTSQTLNELRLAMKVYERLDYNAERCWGGADTLNGFFLRDDVSGEQAAQFHVDNISSDYKSHCGKGNKHNTPSQDQLWGSYLGFALVLKLVDDEPLKAEVRTLARRMINAMQHVTNKGKEVWEIVNPVTGEVVQKWGDIQWMCHAHQSVAEYLTGDIVTFGRSDRGFWKNIWNLLQNNILINKKGDFVWYGVFACSTVMNDGGASEKYCYDWLIKRCAQIAKLRPDMQQSLIFPHLPLISAILYEYQGKKPQQAAQYEAYLNSAPFEGAFHIGSNSSEQQSAAPWHSLSLFCPWHTTDKGYFNMLDYMLLYNAYQLVYHSKLPQFRAF
jgi:hypothetical protein